MAVPMTTFVLAASVALAMRVNASELAATEVESSLMQLAIKEVGAMDKQGESSDCNNIAAGMSTSYNTVAGLHGVSGGTANGITDGLFYADGGWSRCVHTSDWKTDPFVVVDLGATSTFSGIRLNSGPAYTNPWATGAEIRVSDTPLTSPSDFWAATLCATLPSGFSSANTWFDVPCSTAVSGRYVGYIVPGNNKIVMFCEIEVCQGGETGASALGDPHLQNVYGDRFDLMQQGRHVLINIPRGMSAENSLLRVEADARRVGDRCADMYFQELNVTGSWAEAQQAGGYQYVASQNDDGAPKWLAFGPMVHKVELKVVRGRTDTGIRYLNVYVKHLGHAGIAVGGLLGGDDHGEVSVLPAFCARQMQLQRGRARSYHHNSASVAAAVA